MDNILIFLLGGLCGFVIMFLLISIANIFKGGDNNE